jgi:uncharacterized protein YkwD
VLRWSFSALALFCALEAVGCGGSSGGGGGGGAPAPTGTVQQVGSQFWYVGDTFGNALKTHTSGEASLAQQVVNLVNQERLDAGQVPLLVDGEAEEAAKAHAEDMQGRSYFSHTTPEGWSPATRLQLLDATGFTRVGENIAMGQPTAQDVMTAWMNSTGHRNNILDPGYTHIGVGVVEAPGPYWVQVFLTR